MYRNINLNLMRAFVSAAVTAGVLLAIDADAASFTPIDNRSQPSIQLRQLSADGSAVIGTIFDYASTGARTMFRWTRSSGLTVLSGLEGELNVGHANAISADGSIVVGESLVLRGANHRIVMAYRWTPQTGQVELGTLSTGGYARGAYDVSADGSAIVGWGFSPAGRALYRWTAETGAVELVDLTNRVNTSGRFSISDDGSAIVGAMFHEDSFEAFRWTAQTGAVGLGDLPGGSFRSFATGVSPDGSVVIGTSVSESGVEAHRWTAQTGMVGLGVPAGDRVMNAASFVSDDGAVVVGQDSADTGPYVREAFRWTAETGKVGLGFLPGGQEATFPESTATGISADSSVIAGRSTSSSGIRAFVWDPTYGMRSVHDLLTDAGIDLTGWTLNSVQDISADGSIVVGFGLAPDGESKAWLADLSGAPGFPGFPGPVVPEPGALGLMSIMLMGLSVRRRGAPLNAVN